MIRDCWHHLATILIPQHLGRRNVCLEVLFLTEVNSMHWGRAGEKLQSHKGDTQFHKSSAGHAWPPLLCTPLLCTGMWCLFLTMFKKHLLFANIQNFRYFSPKILLTFLERSGNTWAHVSNLAAGLPLWSAPTTGCCVSGSSAHLHDQAWSLQSCAFAGLAFRL